MKTVLITGASKGIGLGIVEGLLQLADRYHVILTSRDQVRGHAEFERLIKKDSQRLSMLSYHQLDITDPQSISRCLSWMKTKFGTIDILVNNAGVATKGPGFDLDVYQYTFATNVFGTIDLTEKLLGEGLIRRSGRIVNIGSVGGDLKHLTSEELKNEFRNPSLNVSGLLNLAKKFANSIKQQTCEQDGWPKSAYRVSKMIINTYARVLAQRTEIQNLDISVFSCHPGWVKTDMAGPSAELTVEEGAATPLFLITLRSGIDSEFQGKYFDQTKQVASFDN